VSQPLLDLIERERIVTAGTGSAFCRKCGRVTTSVACPRCDGPACPECGRCPACDGPAASTATADKITVGRSAALLPAARPPLDRCVPCPMPRPLLIAVIFFSYFGCMTAFVAYACAQGRPPRRDEDDEGRDEAEPRPGRKRMGLAA
jgi:hypothetical protein